MKERTIRTRRIYNGRIISVREDTVRLINGVISKREIVEHPGAVAVVAMTGDGRVVLVKQFRKSAEKVLLEIPAGLAHKGERLDRAAKRELREETGYRAERIRKVFAGYSSPGYSTEIITIFIATGLKKVGQDTDHDEMIDVEIVPLKKALSFIRSGRIRDNKTALGIMIANLIPPLSGHPSPVNRRRAVRI